MLRFCLFLTILSINCVGAKAETVGFAFANDRFEIKVIGASADVSQNGSSIFRGTAIEASLGAVIASDFNFDNYPDLALLRDSGIERYFDVLLFDKKQKRYVKNSRLSSIPCPETDPSRKLVISTCNHASACENWKSYFQYERNRLAMVRREGVTCDPVSGKGYRYYEVYREGKVIEQETLPLIENE